MAYDTVKKVLSGASRHMISVSLALSQTPTEAARPQIRGLCIAWHARLLPSFRWYLLTDSEGMAR